LDYAGIGINMAFSPIPCFYYSLYCHESTAQTYITIILLAGCATFATQMIDWFKKK
jgi:predicted membrane channel-forming protein YqfA (hemolysin III family)